MKNLGDVRKLVQKALAESGNPNCRFGVVRRYHQAYDGKCDIYVTLDDADIRNGDFQTVWQAINKIPTGRQDGALEYTDQKRRKRTYDSVALVSGWVRRYNFTESVPQPRDTWRGY